MIEGTLGLTAFTFISRYFEDADLLPGFLAGYSKIHHDEHRSEDRAQAVEHVARAAALPPKQDPSRGVASHCGHDGLLLRQLAGRLHR